MYGRINLYVLNLNICTNENYVYINVNMCKYLHMYISTDRFLCYRHFKLQTMFSMAGSNMLEPSKNKKPLSIRVSWGIIVAAGIVRGILNNNMNYFDLAEGTLLEEIEDTNMMTLPWLTTRNLTIKNSFFFFFRKSWSPSSTCRAPTPRSRRMNRLALEGGGPKQLLEPLRVAT